MKVLVACEESQTVCKAFRERGHEAYSCDIQEPSGGHPEWHILGDAVEALRGGCIQTMDMCLHDVGRWDLAICHPPCTYLSNAGAARLYKVIDGKTYIERSRFEKGLDGKDFFLKMFEANADRIAVENQSHLAYTVCRCTRNLSNLMSSGIRTRRRHIFGW